VANATPWPFYPRERAQEAFLKEDGWHKGWVWRREKLCPSPRFKHQIIQSLASCYTNYVTPVPENSTRKGKNQNNKNRGQGEGWNTVGHLPSGHSNPYTGQGAEWKGLWKLSSAHSNPYAWHYEEWNRMGLLLYMHGNGEREHCSGWDGMGTSACYTPHLINVLLLTVLYLNSDSSNFLCSSPQPLFHLECH